MKPKYSIIIPTKNEEEAIAKVICSIPPKIARFSEIIVVDSSEDMTSLIAKKLGAKVIKAKKGKGRAMKIGAKKSKGDVLIFLDGDGTDPPTHIPRLLTKLKSSNLVLGCRTMKKFRSDDLVTRQIFKVYSVLIRPMFNIIGFKVSDPLAGFRAIRREDWERLNLKSNGFEIEAEMNVKAIENKFVVKEVAIPHLKRGGGLIKSKFLASPKSWFRIMNIVIKHIKDKKIKIRLKEFGRLKFRLFKF